MTKLYKEQRNNSKFFKEVLQRVVDWNAIARNKSSKDPKEFAASFTQDAFELQIDLVTEELKEYRDAIIAKDHTEAVDAMADTFVVSSFLVYMFFGPESTEKFLEFPVGDRFSDDPLENFLSAREAFTKPEQMAFYVAMIMRIARDSLNKTTYDGLAAMNEVLRSNDSKFPKTYELEEAWETDIEYALEEEKKWIESVRGYGPVTHSFNEEHQVHIFHDANGKIMKGSTYSEPNIKQFIK